MVFITGDTHIPIDIHKLSGNRFQKQRELTQDDFVIICGDFGGVWDGGKEELHWLTWLDRKNFTTLFVDGNHENHRKLAGYEVVDFHGGKARGERNRKPQSEAFNATIQNKALKSITTLGASLFRLDCDVKGVISLVYQKHTIEHVIMFR